MHTCLIQVACLIEVATKTGFTVQPREPFGTKNCSNGLSHMTKMAAMPIYDKNLKKILFSGTKTPMTLKLSM